ncbi:hypothetical protein BLOT_008214 [Blomia tropicalis]|nr:hypothetical protein BLOT_008214 [Blomia tropicalis]
MDVLEQIDATHVVVGIQWGGKVLISVEDTNSENIDKEEIEGNLAGKIKGLTSLFNVEGNLDGNIADEMKEELNKFSFEIFGDILPTLVPTNLIEGIEIMKNAPSLVKDANNGKGKQIKYKLIPISLLRNLWKVNTEANKIFRYIEEEAIQKCVELFDNMNLIEQQLNDLLEDVNKLEPFIESSKVKQVKLLHLNYSFYQTKLRNVLSDQLFLIRSGNETTSKLDEVIFQTTNDPFSWENVAIKIDQLSDLKKEISFLKLMIKLNIILLNKNNEFQQFLWENFENDIYIFFYDYNQTNNVNKYMNQFRRMIERREEYGAKVLFVAANIDVFNKLISNKTKISLYRNGACYMEHYELGSNTHNNTNDPQEWSLFDIQNKLSGQIKEVSVLKTQLNNHETTINQQQSTIDQQKSTINNLKNNPIPINFIYVQLSNQQKPKDIWLNVEWKDVTSEYSGLFFRAEGGDAAEFGTIQEDNAPRVTTVFNNYYGGQLYYNRNFPLPIGSFSQYIFTGDQGRSNVALKFFTSDGEVRPRNMAMRIWKRIG